MKKYFLLTISLFIIVNNIIAQPPVGYYNNATGKSCATLKTALKTIINTGNTPKSYSALWDQYLLTDIKPRTVGTGSANVIYDMYSAIPGGTDPYQFTPTVQRDSGTQGTAEGQRYNKEHGVPKSWFNGNTGVNGIATDYLYVIPADKFINGKRGEMPYCKVATASQTFLNGSRIGSSAIAGITGDGANKVFEPLDSFKGDVAREFFYFLTMYEDNLSALPSNVTAAQAIAYNTFPSATIAYLQLMLQWHHLDPVSSKELIRNNGAYSFQHNRNPYIDHPEWVDSVWNGKCPGLSALPVDIISFNGKLVENNIVLKWDIGDEVNVKQYEIERSLNGVDFIKQTTVEANNSKAYEINDFVGNIDGRNIFYRIKKIDKDGKFAYSKILTIYIPVLNKLEVYPNPITDFVKIKLNNTDNIAAQIFVTDVTGRNILSKNVLLQNGFVNINLSSVNNGTYLLQVAYNNQKFATKILVNK